MLLMWLDNIAEVSKIVDRCQITTSLRGAVFANVINTNARWKINIFLNKISVLSAHVDCYREMLLYNTPIISFDSIVDKWIYVVISKQQLFRYYRTLSHKLFGVLNKRYICRKQENYFNFFLEKNMFMWREIRIQFK